MKLPRFNLFYYTVVFSDVIESTRFPEEEITLDFI